MVKCRKQQVDGYLGSLKKNKSEAMSQVPWKACRRVRSNAASWAPELRFSHMMDMESSGLAVLTAHPSFVRNVSNIANRNIAA